MRPKSLHFLANSQVMLMWLLQGWELLVWNQRRIFVIKNGANNEHFSGLYSLCMEPLCLIFTLL